MRGRLLVGCVALAACLTTFPPPARAESGGGRQNEATTTNSSSPHIAGNFILSPHPLSDSQIQHFSGRVQAAASGEVTSYPTDAWHACGAFSSRWQQVADFGSGVKLLCGPNGTINGHAYPWGYWHIKYRHMDEMQTMMYATNNTWTDLLYWA